MRLPMRLLVGMHLRVLVCFFAISINSIATVIHDQCPLLSRLRQVDGVRRERQGAAWQVDGKARAAHGVD